MVSKCNALNGSAALLMAMLGAACSSSNAVDDTDGGERADGAKAVEGGDAAGMADAAESGDGANEVDGAASAGAAPVNLGMAGTYVILAQTAISTVPASAITGNIGISPAAASFITGFSLTADATNVFATSSQVTGKVYAADYAVPTPSTLTTAIADMQTAFTDAAGRAADVTELGAGNIGGKTIAPGVYKWGTALLVPTNVTLSGAATDVWIFQVAQDLTLSSASTIVLAGGATPANVFWEVAGAVHVGTTAHLEGVVLSQTAINLDTGASVHGRLLAQTAVSIDGSAVVQP